MYDTNSDVSDKDGIKHDVDKYRLQIDVSAGLYRSMYRVLQWERESCR
jgi:hypothetical protein